MQKAKSPAEVPYWGTKSEYIEFRGKRYNPTRYCGKGLPRFPLPSGYYLVHNYVRPTDSLGLNGFRAWVQKGCTWTKLIECNCNFGGMKNNTVNKHYRVIVVPDQVN